MKTKHLIKGIIFFAVFISFSCMSLCQESKVNRTLLGHWREYKIMKVNGDTTNWNGKPFAFDFDFELYLDGIGQNTQFGQEKFEYSLKKDTLKIGEIVYIVDKLTKEELVIRESNASYPDDPEAFIHFLKKVFDKND